GRSASLNPNLFSCILGISKIPVGTGCAIREPRGADARAVSPPKDFGRQELCLKRVAARLQSLGCAEAAMKEIPTEDLTWLHAAVERFEQEWKKGPRPRIEDYLSGAE